jgi:hypothetical protein
MMGDGVMGVDLDPSMGSNEFSFEDDTDDTIITYPSSVDG